MKKLLAVVVALAFLILALVVVRRGPVPAPPSAWLVLPDGSSNRIVAVTYGTNHLIGPLLGRMIAHLPQAVQDELPVLIHQTETPEPALVVWIEHRVNPGIRTPPSFSDYKRLADHNGFISGPQNPPAGCFGTLDIGPTIFEAFPRRDPKLTVNFFYPSPTGQVTNCGSLQFPNPLYRAYPDYPEWQPEALPATKRAADVEVTLLDVRTGYDSTARTQYRKGGGSETTRGTNRLDGANNTEVKLRIRSLADTNQIWKAVGVQVSDATGNTMHSSGMSWNGIGPNFAFSPGLWPSERTWKLKLEIKQAEGFTPEKLFTVKNVPLGAIDSSNAVGWTTNFNGVTVTLAGILRRPPNTNNSWNSSQLSAVALTNSTLPAGTQLDLLTVAFDQGTTNFLENWEYTDNTRTYFFRQIPLDAKSADITFALHQSRFFEFTVHPELALPATNSAGR
jgi:hypothetical protein